MTSRLGTEKSLTSFYRVKGFTKNLPYTNSLSQTMPYTEGSHNILYSLTFLLLKIKLTIEIFFSSQDYWFFKQLDVSPLKTKNMTVHLMKVRKYFFELLLVFGIFSDFQWLCYCTIQYTSCYIMVMILYTIADFSLSCLYTSFNLFTYNISKF